jgi:hypothetical protein
MISEWTHRLNRKRRYIKSHDEGQLDALRWANEQVEAMFATFPKQKLRLDAMAMKTVSYYDANEIEEFLERWRPT